MVGIPAAAPGGGAGGKPPASPQGASPATSPVPNKGLEAAGLAELSQVVRLLEQLVPKLGLASEAGRAAAESALKLAKHVPPGSVAPGPQGAALQQMAQKQRQMQPQIAQMRAGGGAPGAGGAAPAPPGGAAA